MYTQFLIACFVLAGLSCQSRLVHTAENSPVLPTDSRTNSQTNTEVQNSDPLKIVECSSDAKHFGVPHNNKIEINRFEGSDANLTTIKFYALGGDKQWILKQSLEFDKEYGPGFDPKIEDFNNDGFKDVTYVSGEAARGANEIRTLFIYDKKRNELVRIKNSADYPNLGYIKKLDCISSFMVHGASTTVFLRLDGEMLREFASVGTGLERVVFVTDNDGNERELSRRKMKEQDVYTRYRNFNPPQ